MKFAVVVPTFNRKAVLRQCIEALAKQDYPDFEVIVVDDGSTDQTSEMIVDEFPKVRFLTQDHRGPAAARNRGVAGARGEIIAFTDDDCVAPRNWLTRLADGYARHPRVAGVGGYLQAPNGILDKNALAL
jgi:glycosyltransferase involved in cell wall biosynthesis